jgi:F-type H+-transporting ATPase subunit b
MQIDWTTFVLEIVNFLVLVWILKRFFYAPVLAMIDRRRAAVTAESEDARKLKEDAEALKATYESRLSDWDKERAGLRLALNDEFAKERSRQLAALQQSLAAEAEAARQRAGADSAQQDAARRQAARQESFAAAAAMLRRVAAPELTEAIAKAFIADLDGLAAPDRARLGAAAAALQGGVTVVVTSAHPLAADHRAALAVALEKASGKIPAPTFREDAALIAGLRVALGAYLLSADLAGELAFFQAEPDGHG